jgi:hypothetical protein
MASIPSPAMNTNGNKATSNPWDIPVGGGGAGGEYVCCPPGNFPGTIVGIFDIGYQAEKDMKTQTLVERRKVVLIYELAKKQPDGKPFVLAKRYTWSMNEKSNLYKDVTNITGARFKEGEKFNPLSLLGVPVMVNVTNTQSGEKTYHDITALSQFPEGFTVPTPTHEQTAWSVCTNEPFPDGMEWLPFVYGKSIKTLAEESVEFKNRSDDPIATSTASNPGTDDDIPF